MSEGRCLAEVVERLEQGAPPAPEAGFLGADLDPVEAALVLIPIPWEATTSYGGGTARGPEAMVRASHQLDLEDGAFDRPYRAGIAFVPEDARLPELNRTARPAARRVIAALERGEEATEDLAAVNRASRELNQILYEKAREILAGGRAVAVVGGDHASPEGLIHALADSHPEGFGVLHLDAHHDLRRAYEGFHDSHASIFFNVMERYPAVSRLVQVGIRDYSRAERLFLEGLGARAEAHYGRDLFRAKAAGTPFQDTVQRFLAPLPDRVYVSFDIDALDPSYCPSTGTPVPGGLSFDEACYILEALAASGRRIIGFDLCEVAPGPDGEEWDANVGARILYKLCGALLRSQGRC